MNNETLADIVVWLRDTRNYRNVQRATWCQTLADRIEAAAEREKVGAVTSKTEADAPAPLPFGMSEAANEANRRYQETRQEFWAGLADLLADAVAVNEYREADRRKVASLRDLVRRLADIVRHECTEEGMALTREAYAALEEEVPE